MLSFNNTKIAFASKSNEDLNRAYLVFKLISIAWLNSFATSLLQLGLRLKLPLKPIIRATVFNQFCGGENIKDCDATISDLGNFNVKTILDYSVEGKQVDEDFDNCLQKISTTIDRAKADDNIPFAVVKLTGLIPFDVLEKKQIGDLNAGDQERFDRGKDRLQALCLKAFQNEVPMLIDAEESWIQDTIDALAEEMMLTYNKDQVIIYNTAQMYRHDRLAYIQKLHQESLDHGYFIGLKIVRGAYMEKERERAENRNYPSPIQKDKAATDADFDKAIAFCIDHLDQINLICGTHNEKSSLLLSELMQSKNLANNHPKICFSQLLGMSDHISFNLAEEGYNVAKYVPFGPIKDVMPYLIRRANENTSISGQTGRELSLIMQERKRRKNPNN